MKTTPLFCTPPAVLVLVASLVSACSSPDGAARVDAVGPDQAQFAVVVPMLINHCGSIDCHGSIYRNMRLYGQNGTRLAPGIAPDGVATTADEIAADYQAVVGVEPEIMAQVVADKGAGTERLTLVRKARGEEAHKGGQRIVPNSNADTCLRTWLSSTTDTNACGLAASDP